jgi:Terminase RNaseH-like domain
MRGSQTRERNREAVFDQIASAVNPFIPFFQNNAASESQRKADAASHETSEIYRVLRDKVAQAAAIGMLQSMWSLFVPMVNIQTQGTVKPFVAYDYQVDLIQTIEENTNTVICKSRQMGISEAICSYLLMRAITEPGFSAVVFSKTQDDAAELGRRIRDMAVSLGPLCPKMASESARKLAFKGLGRIHFLPVTARAARGIPSVSVVLFDEAGFIDSIDGVYQAAIPTLSMLGDKGKVIFNSTPNGRTGLFYRLIIAGAGEQKRVASVLEQLRQKPAANNIVPFTRETARPTWVHRKWAKVFLHWRIHPIYGADPDWAEKTREERQLTQAQWDQEYELQFAEGLSQVFDPDLLDRAIRSTWLDQPIYGHRYIAGIDPNNSGKDFWCVRVWDVTSTPYALVAQYRANRKTKDFCLAKTLDLLDDFNPASISIETNGGGQLVMQDLIAERPSWRINPVNTSNTSKILNTDRLLLLLERDSIIFPPDGKADDQIGSEEYRHFIESMRGALRQREAEAGSNDDTVMADAIAFSNLDAIPKPRSYSGSTTSDQRRKSRRTGAYAAV